ncbi:MAG: (2Fe-2S)-binding protein [Opitutales bacterium]
MGLEELSETNASTQLKLKVTVNGELRERSVEPRLLLSDFLRHELELTGTHVGCEHGVCGACTVVVDGQSVRSCLMFAIQAEGSVVETVESLADENGMLSPLQSAFKGCHALQCGFCTPGMLMTLKSFVESCSDPSEQEIRNAIAGNICRCTGYHNIVKAVQQCIQSEGETE